MCISSTLSLLCEDKGGKIKLFLHSFFHLLSIRQLAVIWTIFQSSSEEHRWSYVSQQPGGYIYIHTHPRHNKVSVHSEPHWFWVITNFCSQVVILHFEEQACNLGAHLDSQLLLEQWLEAMAKTALTSTPLVAFIGAGNIEDIYTFIPCHLVHQLL